MVKRKEEQLQKWEEMKSGCCYAVVTEKGLLLCRVDVKTAVARRSVKVETVAMRERMRERGRLHVRGWRIYSTTQYLGVVLSFY